MNRPRPKSTRGLSPSEWEPLFRAAGILVPDPSIATSQRARDTVLGSFLAKNLNREVPVEVDGMQGRARLRVADAGQRRRRYFFEITLDDSAEPPPQPESDPDEAERLVERGPDRTAGAMQPAP